MPVRTDLWFNLGKANPSAKLRLFCFPYAGGSAAVFSDWDVRLGGDIEVVAVQPPGRGNRFVEEPIASLDETIRQLVQAIAPLLDKPFAFFGHSNGALVCFELARALTRMGRSENLRHIVVSGNPAPQVRTFDSMLHSLPDEDLKEKLRELRGTPEEILQNAELLEVFMPVLRADFSIAETYDYAPAPPLECDLSIFGGLEDHNISRVDLLAWGELFQGSVEMNMFEGGHFFINEDKATVLSALRSRLENAMAGAGGLAYGNA